MSPLTAAIAPHAGKFAAAIVASAFGVTAYDTPPDAAELSALSARFAFDEKPLPGAAGSPDRKMRNVHPDLSRISGWISSVGASVALADLDNDGLPNDYCLVDPRNDSVTIGPVPVPGPERYPAITLPTPVGGFDPQTLAPMGCLPADINADGRTDLVIYYWGRGPVIFEALANLPAVGNYRSVSLTRETVPWFTNAAIFADVDGDGYGDLMFGNYFADGSGVLDTSGELPVDMQHSMSRADNGGTNRLFLNTGSRFSRVAFRDATDVLSPDMASGWTLALGAADLDGDLLPEIYIANDFGPDRMLHNRSRPGNPDFAIAEGRRGLTDIRSSALGRDSFKGMGVDFADVDGDGRLDIYVSNIAEEYALMESHFLFLHTGEDDAWQSSRAPYHNASGRLGLARSAWSWDAKLADFDNDGRPEALQTTGFLQGATDRWPELHELAIANDELLRHAGIWPVFTANADLSGDAHDRFFVADTSGVYRDIAQDIGLGQASVSRGIATADVDGDGDLDFAIARQWQPSSFYLNVSSPQYSSLVLDLHLKNRDGGMRSATGAVARFTTSDGHARIGFADGGNGHSGRRSSQIHFGLGAQAGNEPLEVRLSWRDESGPHSRTVALASGNHQIVLNESQVAKAPIQPAGDRQ